MSSSVFFFPSNSKTEQPAQSFLQALPDANHVPKHENDAIYVHPLVRKSSAKLSKMSLEMCTESLGSETGCDIIMEEPMISSSNFIHKKPARTETKAKRECEYPPPLTSISESVSVECYRANGRLVVNAVVFMETSNSLFQAERVDGCLTLRFKKAEGDAEEDKFDDSDEEGSEDGGDKGNCEKC